MAASDGTPRPPDLLKLLQMGTPEPAHREAMVMVLLSFFIGLIVLLSIDFTTNPPTFNPMILLFGILVAGLIWMARRAGHGWQKCPACGRSVPGYSVYCPICGARLP